MTLDANERSNDSDGNTQHKKRRSEEWRYEPDPNVALPPWHDGRTTIRLDEVPNYLMRLYNTRFTYKQINRWRRRGVWSKRMQKRIYLKTFLVGIRRFVKKKDLHAFLEAPP